MLFTHTKSSMEMAAVLLQILDKCIQGLFVKRADPWSWDGKHLIEILSRCLPQSDNLAKSFKFTNTKFSLLECLQGKKEPYER